MPRKSKKNGKAEHCSNSINFLNILDRCLSIADSPLPLYSDCHQVPLERGFSALPVGNYNNGNFNNVGSNANFWSATENNASNANNWNVNAGNANLNNNNKNNGFAVRCLQTPASEGFSPSELFSMLTKAYYEARRHKRNTKNQLEFERNLEENLLELAYSLMDGSYRPLPSVCFINERPVKREVIAANFRDRVVHHLLYSWIYPIFDRQFINDSYSCRIGKGTLYGIKRISRYIKSESQNFTQECYVLHLDVSGFFMSIDRNILYKLCIEGLKRGQWKNIPDRNLCVRLLREFVYLNPLENVIYKSPPEKWIGLPANKSLKNVREKCGLPIGNLTSQLFGNVYMNPLDQFVKHRLKIRCYGRYVDDIILVHRDKARLLSAIQEIRNYLKGKLKLELHPNKIYLQQIECGCSFLGAYILPWRIYPGQRLVRNFVSSVRNPITPLWKQKNRLVSYIGFLKHYDSHRLLLRWIQRTPYQ